MAWESRFPPKRLSALGFQQTIQDSAVLCLQLEICCCVIFSYGALVCEYGGYRCHSSAIGLRFMTFCLRLELLNVVHLLVRFTPLVILSVTCVSLLIFLLFFSYDRLLEHQFDRARNMTDYFRVLSFFHVL